MAGLFAKAAAAQKSEPKKPAKKATVWLADPNSQEELKRVHEAVNQLVELDRQAKTISAKMGPFKKVVLDHANENFLSDFAELGVPPETPMHVQNADGQKVTFVVQDRSGQYAVKDEQLQILTQILGEDAANDLVFEEMSFGFNRMILSIPGVMEVVEAALERAIKKLVDAGTLTSDQAGELLDVSVKRAFKPGTLDRLAVICGRNKPRMGQVLEAMGGSATRYVKT